MPTTTTTNPQRSPQVTDDDEFDPVVEALTVAHARAKLMDAADLVAHVRGLVVPAARSRPTASHALRAPKRRSRSALTPSSRRLLDAVRTGPLAQIRASREQNHYTDKVRRIVRGEH